MEGLGAEPAPRYVKTSFPTGCTGFIKIVMMKLIGMVAMLTTRLF